MKTGRDIGEIPGGEERVQRGNTLIKTDDSVVMAEGPVGVWARRRKGDICNTSKNKD